MSEVNIEIDPSSGFCFGVVKAIESAEKELEQNQILNCLGDIVHNNMEMQRLEEKGMISINADDLSKLNHKKIFIRAHGEPPHTYQMAKKHNLEVVDATCPVVLKLQKRIKQSWNRLKNENGQVIIYGKKGHAEVVGLVGQTDNEAIVIESLDDAKSIDVNKKTHLYAQTTKGIDEFKKIREYLREKINEQIEFKAFDTICRQVANRLPKMKVFAQKHETIIFVGGEKSSNAKMLYQKCKETNAKSYFVSNKNQLKKEWFIPQPNSVGICGATSTPPWLMQNIAEVIKTIIKEQ